MASLLHWGNRNCLFLKMTKISHVASFAIASTHNSGLTIISSLQKFFRDDNINKNLIFEIV